MLWAAALPMLALRQNLAALYELLGAYLQLKSRLLEPVCGIDLERRRLALALHNGRVGDGFGLIVPRLLDTLIGSLIAGLAVWLVLPSWQSRRLPSVAAQALRTQAQYLREIMAHTGPASRITWPTGWHGATRTTPTPPCPAPWMPCSRSRFTCAAMRGPARVSWCCRTRC